MRRLSCGLLLLSSVWIGCSDAPVDSRSAPKKAEEVEQKPSEPVLDELPCQSVEYHGYSYEVTEIDGRCWFAENLRTEKYRDGSTIATDLSDAEWSATTNGATTVFGSGSSSCIATSADFDACNDSLSLEVYGRMYNWYAVTDSRHLCPDGWHVPTGYEWHLLSLNRGKTVLMSTSGWGKGVKGNDALGFHALPGGFRVKGGTFMEAGYEGDWWTSSPGAEKGRSTSYSIAPGYYDVQTNVRSQSQCGFSVRCLKDAEVE